MKVEITGSPDFSVGVDVVEIVAEVGTLIDEPAGTILAKIKTVDGAGSGLSADTLHDKTASDFASDTLDNVQDLPTNLYDAIKVDGGYF